MKSKDIQLSGGHKLKYFGGDIWDFVPYKKDSRAYLTFNEKGTDIISLDADSMGMPLMVGCIVGEYKIYGIHNIDGIYKVCMLPLHKKNVHDLIKGDIIYIVNTLDYTFKTIVISRVEFTINEEYILIWNKDDNQDCIVFSTKKDRNLQTGISLEHKDGILAFSNEKNAKKYLYDKIQDKIIELRDKQRSLYK